jgi:PPOX class probable F420-dependent enzyme
VRTKLDIADVGDLLDSQLLATLATYDGHGVVRLSPVWFLWSEGGFTIAIGIDDVKARHLRNDSRASVVVAELETPMRGVEVRGVAELLPQSPEIDRRIAERYIDAREVDGYLAGVPPGVIVRLEPGELRVWDFFDEYS